MDTARYLVTGGAGYIGSNTTLQLLDAGYDVVVVDNLSRGNRNAVAPERLRVVDLLDTDGLVRVMNEKPCDARGPRDPPSRNTLSRESSPDAWRAGLPVIGGALLPAPNA